MSLTFIEPVDLRCEYGTRYHLVSSLQFVQSILPFRNFWDLGLHKFEHDIAAEYYLPQVRKRGIRLLFRSYPRVPRRVGVEIAHSSPRCWI